MASERTKERSLRRKLPTSSPADGTGADVSRKIGEAARLVGVEPYVLRFWQTEFPFIRPKQSRSRHRHYSPADVETLKIIKRLLHTEGYTIAGARKFIREKGLDSLRGVATARSTGGKRNTQQLSFSSADSSLSSAAGAQMNGIIHRALREIREDLRALHKLLDSC
jgi:DNA-binding transcriptional MerR regulator